MSIAQEKKGETFAEKVFTDITSMLVTLLACVGDRLELFKHLAQGPATDEELAVRAQINQRYALEWLRAMTCAGYIEYNPETGRFTLPPTHVSVLAQEESSHFVGGMHQELVGVLPIFQRLLTAFRKGGGVPMDAYGADAFEGMARLSENWFEHSLVQQWIPALPVVESKLLQGTRVADIGCGHGHALIKLAQAYPESTYTGFEIFAPLVACATANAQAANVADRVRFVHLDVSAGLPEQYDMITTFNMVHDAANPRTLLASIYRALSTNGHYLCTEANCSDKLEENIGTSGALFYCSSVLFCMTTSLAQHGEGLGTLGLPETRLRELCLGAGFRNVRRISIESSFDINALYEITS